MVRLLHHYETSTHRIFLLLEYVGGGRLLDFVSRKRAQWKKLHEAASNPPPSSSLLLSEEDTTATITTSSSSTRTHGPTAGRDEGTAPVVVKEDRTDKTMGKGE